MAFETVRESDCLLSHQCVLAWQQLGLGGEQLLVEGREERVHSERVALTEPAQLLHVQAAQWVQRCHLLVELQRGTRARKYVTSVVHAAMNNQSKVARCCLYYLDLRELPCAWDPPGCLGAECVWGLTPRSAAPAAPGLCPPDMDGLQRWKVVFAICSSVNVSLLAYSKYSSYSGNSDWTPWIKQVKVIKCTEVKSMLFFISLIHLYVCC